MCPPQPDALCTIYIAKILVKCATRLSEKLKLCLETKSIPELVGKVGTKSSLYLKNRLKIIIQLFHGNGSFVVHSFSVLRTQVAEGTVFRKHMVICRTCGHKYFKWIPLCISAFHSKCYILASLKFTLKQHL